MLINILTNSQKTNINHDNFHINNYSLNKDFFKDV